MNLQPWLGGHAEERRGEKEEEEEEEGTVLDTYSVLKKPACIYCTLPAHSRLEPNPGCRIQVGHPPIPLGQELGLEQIPINRAQK